MYCLRIFGTGGDRVFPIADPIVTGGSDLGNEIRIDAPGFPALAFRLCLVQDGVRFASVDPNCKATVNGKRTDSALLRPGDRVEMGSVVLILDRPEGHSSVSSEFSDFSKNSRESTMAKSLTRLCALVAQERDLRILLEKVMGLVRETFGGDEAFLFTLDDAGEANLFVGTKAGGNPRRLYSDTLVSKVLREGKGIFIRNAMDDPAYSCSESIVQLQLRSVLCCPIAVGGRTSGVIYVGSRLPSISYTANDLAELEVLAMVAGCLINHVGFITLQKKLLATMRAPGEVSFIATSPAMSSVQSEAEAVAGGDISVLLQGETGTGKDVLAHFIHQRSRRRKRPFVVVNCSTLKGELLASELFGHKKGSFTGAVSDRPGLFLAANGGTLFLDEIGEMDLPLQAMLLRALESGKIRPVGQVSEIDVDVRILSASNRNLEQAVENGSFRQDLYFRVNQHLIHLPPLRDRGEDILVLAHHFLEKSRGQYPDKRIEGFHPESLSAMLRYGWPGNVRELANTVGKSVLFADSPVIRFSLPEKGGNWIEFNQATRNFQAAYLQKALALCAGDKEKAAQLLGIGRSTFFRHLSQT